ncbi:hypothetical protein KP509_18G024300 [Ceratopteris richardii]|uniref:Uncharacterized protein n=1 Tax=Ceratopteris richardii TaxID=49495 RepID=A0A8T2SN57_CERRI|nr:hypothetical protein KP509_18G024300 [Ceratopteris richardii]
MAWRITRSRLESVESKIIGCRRCVEFLALTEPRVRERCYEVDCAMECGRTRDKEIHCSVDTAMRVGEREKDGVLAADRCSVSERERVGAEMAKTCAERRNRE